MGMAMYVMHGYAQNANSLRAGLDDFRKSVKSELNDFRKQCMEEYIEFASNPWKEFVEEKPMPKPNDDPKPPVVKPEDDKDDKKESHPVVIEDVVPPVVTPPQPQPVQPIEEVPVVEEKRVAFSLYGTPLSVRFDEVNKVILKNNTERGIAKALGLYREEAYDNMLIDCLELRNNLRLNDWGYLQLLKSLAYKVHGGKNNNATLMLAYLFMQSGYKMRLAMCSNVLYVLFATDHVIYENNSYRIDGDVYYGAEPLPNRLNVCEASFPKEQNLSLVMGASPKLAKESGNSRQIASKRYQDVKADVRVNKNLMSFYSDYPTSMIGEDFMTRWALYANTPMADDVKEQLYPQLRSFLSGKSALESANILLNWVQTGFEYEYDVKVWGSDRAFFAEESLHYPYCDCEDRAILYTRLVRDLLGLKCILVFYPGHLACAVNLPDATGGDYVTLAGKKYIVADPTYIGAPVGETMPDMNNSKAKVILLE